MKKILITAYDVDPYKGSESGLGWNIIYQASRYNNIQAITRLNNRPAIEKYIEEQGLEINNLEFHYFDLPYWMRFWKVGGRGATLYFYLWQIFITAFIKYRGFSFDIAHNVNFSTDSIPSFLWVFGKPFIWGPINHHEKIPKAYLSKYNFKSFLKDRKTWLMKCFLWRFDIFNRIARNKADRVLGGNSSVKFRLSIDDSKFILFPSSGAKSIEACNETVKDGFNIIVAGRFVPLKGIDVAINSYIKFLEQNPTVKDTTLTIIGKGEEEGRLKSMADLCLKNGKINFIEWLPLEELIIYYKTASLFLFPSHEGAGMVVVEAMSYGLPIICFDNYGPGELIDQNSGIKIKYSSYEVNISDYAMGIDCLYRDAELLDRLSQGAKNRFKECFTWDIKGLMLKEIYEEL